MDLFSLRAAREDDLELINAYAYNEGMDNIPGVEGVTVAVNEDDVCVGFIRVLVDEANVAYVNPVVTYDAWRGFGVGRALIEFVMEHHPEVRLVSRGSSRGFYDALGFEDVSWDAIIPSIVDECDGCDMREECHPQPVTHAGRGA